MFIFLVLLLCLFLFLLFLLLLVLRLLLGSLGIRQVNVSITRFLVESFNIASHFAFGFTGQRTGFGGVILLLDSIETFQGRHSFSSVLRMGTFIASIDGSGSGTIVLSPGEGTDDGEPNDDRQVESIGRVPVWSCV